MKVLGAVALALLTAILTYALTARLNVENAVQQQQVVSLQQFEDSGAKMDAQLSLLVDTILDEKSEKSAEKIEEARSEARTAITLHASQARPLDFLVGTGNVKQYTDALGELRRLTDKVSGRLTARRMGRLHVVLMDYRVRMLREARAEIYRPSLLDRWTAKITGVFS